MAAEAEECDEASASRNDTKGAPVVKSAKPPPESAEGIRVRSLVIVSFWTIVIFLGLPVWWWTTSIYRASLPLQRMSEWADGRACKPHFPLQIFIEAPFLQSNEAVHLVHLIQHALDDSNEFSVHHLRLQLSSHIKPLSRVNASVPTAEALEGRDPDDERHHRQKTALTVRLLQDDTKSVASLELQSQSAVLYVRYGPNQIPSISSSTSTLASLIAAELQSLYVEEQAIIAQILANGHSASNGGVQTHTTQSTSNVARDSRLRTSPPIRPELSARLAGRTTRSLRYAPTYHITISLFTPSAAPSSWEIEAALAENLTPLLDSISHISNFSVDSQVQVHAAFSPTMNSPVYDADHKVWTLREEDLSGFINAAEWPLSPSIGAGPTLNFVLYIPDRSTAPLVVGGSHATSWLMPQWGGVVILNPTEHGSTIGDESSQSDLLTKEAIQPALLTFSHQLLALLGAPRSPPSLPLQLQTLTRIQAASLLFSAASTMGSLARLTKALPTIAIPETVSDAVDSTLTHLRYTCTALKDGHFNIALENARIAEAQAEKGFFEKSMVGQVYFPDEHKVAVYLPLLGPIGVPLIMSAVKELRRLVAKWKARRSGS